MSSVPLPAGAGGPPPGGRADIVIAGLEQAGPSFELRVFVNNPQADAHTETVPDAGYAGSVYVYGYGIPPPGRGHIPMTRYVVATDAVRAAAVKGSSAVVTLVPVAFGGREREIDLSKVEVSLRLDDSPAAR